MSQFSLGLYSDAPSQLQTRTNQFVMVSICGPSYPIGAIDLRYVVHLATKTEGLMRKKKIRYLKHNTSNNYPHSKTYLHTAEPVLLTQNPQHLTDQEYQQHMLHWIFCRLFLYQRDQVNQLKTSSKPAAATTVECKDKLDNTPYGSAEHAQEWTQEDEQARAQLAQAQMFDQKETVEQKQTLQSTVEVKERTVEQKRYDRTDEHISQEQEDQQERLSNDQPVDQDDQETMEEEIFETPSDLRDDKQKYALVQTISAIGTDRLDEPVFIVFCVVADLQEAEEVTQQLQKQVSDDPPDITGLHFSPDRLVETIAQETAQQKIRRNKAYRWAAHQLGYHPVPLDQLKTPWVDPKKVMTRQPIGDNNNPDLLEQDDFKTSAAFMKTEEQTNRDVTNYYQKQREKLAAATGGQIADEPIDQKVDQPVDMKEVDPRADNEPDESKESMYNIGPDEDSTRRPSGDITLLSSRDFDDDDRSDSECDEKELNQEPTDQQEQSIESNNHSHFAGLIQHK